MRNQRLFIRFSDSCIVHLFSIRTRSGHFGDQFFKIFSFMGFSMYVYIICICCSHILLFMYKTTGETLSRE